MKSKVSWLMSASVKVSIGIVGSVSMVRARSALGCSGRFSARTEFQILSFCSKIVVSKKIKKYLLTILHSNFDLGLISDSWALGLDTFYDEGPSLFRVCKLV